MKSVTHILSEFAIQLLLGSLNKDCSCSQSQAILSSVAVSGYGLWAVTESVWTAGQAAQRFISPLLTFPPLQLPLHKKNSIICHHSGRQQLAAAVQEPHAGMRGCSQVVAFPGAVWHVTVFCVCAGWLSSLRPSNEANRGAVSTWSKYPQFFYCTD